MLKTVPPFSQPNSHISGVKYGGNIFIAYLGIILVNIQGGWFSPIHQEMRLITYFQKAFKNPCFEVIQCPFHWSTHILYWNIVYLTECKRPVGGNIFPPPSLGKYPKNFGKIVHIWDYRQDGCGQNISELNCLNVPIYYFIII